MEQSKQNAKTKSKDRKAKKEQNNTVKNKFHCAIFVNMLKINKIGNKENKGFHRKRKCP